MNLKLNLAIALTFATVCASTAFADTINFNNPTGTLGHSQVYNAGPDSVTAYAFGIGGNDLDLFGKNDGGSEHGVGISSTGSQHEITSTTFVQLDLANISGAFSLSIGSTQDVEGFKACVSNTLGMLGTCQDFSSPSPDPYTANFTKGDQFISIIADGTPAAGNVLVDSLTYTPTPVPEPSSLVLLGTGIVAAAGVVRRKFVA